MAIPHPDNDQKLWQAQYSRLKDALDGFSSGKELTSSLSFAGVSEYRSASGESPRHYGDENG